MLRIGMLFDGGRGKAPGAGETKKGMTMDSKYSPSPSAAKTGSEWTWGDWLGQIRCRLGSGRMNYRVEPGLYRLGDPDKSSDVFVSANYKLSFDVLRRALGGMNAWILVLDTKGVNVWCAAGEGTFGTDELVKRIIEADLSNVVAHKKIVVPQLGAPGVAAHLVKQHTGFKVLFGPVRAEDIPAYVAAGREATSEMRTVRFPLSDRLVLTPMEIIPSLKVYPAFALAAFIFFGLGRDGIVFQNGWIDGRPFLILGLLAIFAGALLTPALLDVLPSRSFAVKGWLAGVAVVAASRFAGVAGHGPRLDGFSFLFFPLASSYIALQFTGSTVFTGMSGVKKELKYAVPVYITGASLSLVLLLAHKLKQTGVL